MVNLHLIKILFKIFKRSYLWKIQRLQNNMTWARTRWVWSWARNVSFQHIFPLIDEQSFITISKPREIWQPRKVRWNWSSIQEESSEDQEWNDDRWPNRQSHGDWWTGARNQVAERCRDIGDQSHDQTSVEEVWKAPLKANHRVTNSSED